MKTKIIRIDPDHIDEQAIGEAGEIIKRGGLVAFPTETVYGLGGDALNPEASKKIYASKGRPSDNPLIVHIADLEHLFPIAEEVPEKAKMLASKWWPGPLTMIFRKTELVPYETSGGLDTVAVRFPNHPVALALIRASGGYIAAPSANTSGRPSPTTARHVAEDLDGRIDMILDGGEVRIGLESTIVDFTEEVPVILRPGYINQEMLKEILGEVRMDPGLQSENEHVRPKAPGMRYRHYAPKAELTIVEGKRDDVVRKINELTARAISENKKVGVIAAEETASLYPRGDIRNIGSRAADKEIARNLYSVLRDFDEDQVDVIFSESFETPRMGQAIMNRLLKAAGHKVITI
ncbi:MAG: threonylcarbamoyl-AMP synthase [Lachnospiraceae bacterium]|nr:threonylcarbamoyl-AMP synthase [Lachnospiraceae bacterium]MCI1727089.1 threonylcarbamoyl-AMP synthase [Lachnospiraceae bacterium]